MFRTKRSCLGFIIGAALSTFLLAYALIYALTGRLLVPGDEGARLITVHQAADELYTLVEGTRGQYDES